MRPDVRVGSYSGLRNPDRRGGESQTRSKVTLDIRDVDIQDVPESTDNPAWGVGPGKDSALCSLADGPGIAAMAGSGTEGPDGPDIAVQAGLGIAVSAGARAWGNSAVLPGCSGASSTEAEVLAVVVEIWEQSCAIAVRSGVHSVVGRRPRLLTDT